MSAGRLLREQMRDVDAPERVAERLRHRQACDQAHRELVARFGELTTENAAQAIAWQTARIAELDTVSA